MVHDASRGSGSFVDILTAFTSHIRTLDVFITEYNMHHIEKSRYNG